MAKKVIPFPQPAPSSLRPVIDRQSRVIVHIGKQRIALDISCQATVLNPVPAPVVEAPVNSIGGEQRPAPKP
jgi:hypothetical protein